MPIDPLTCRICLGASSSFISIFSKFHNRSVKIIYENLTQIKIQRNSKIPKFICEACFTKILQAEVIVNLSRKNDLFLKELASVEVEEEEIREKDSEEEEVIVEIVENHESPTTIIYEEPDPEITAEIPWESFELINRQVKSCQKSSKISTFFCSFCGREFPTRQKLNYHEKSRHSQLTSGRPIKPFTCDRCGVTFKQRSHIINHLNVVHLKIKRFQCNICGFAMYSKTHYTQHLKIHENLREFGCLKCDKSFARKETLNTHLKVHEGLRPYVCKICGKSYTAHTDLKKHFFKHTRVHPYICQLCKGGFFLKRELFEHVAMKHKGVDTTSWLNGKTSWVNVMN